MTVHRLKVDPHLWPAVRDNLKKAEVRINDRDYQKDDLLILYPLDRATGLRIGDDEVMRSITHIVCGGQYGIEPGYCLLSMTAMEKPAPTAGE